MSEETSIALEQHPKCTLTATSLVIDESASLEEWIEIGKQLKSIRDAVQWRIGDWLLHGEGKPQWGGKYEEAVKMLGLTYGTIAIYKSVSKSFQSLSRLKNLSWSHHYEVASLDEDARRELLEMAAPAIEGGKPSLTTKELRKKADARQCGVPESNDTPVVHEPEIVPGVYRGIGIQRGHEAIDCLKRIPKTDGLRAEAFKMVFDWMKLNK